MDTKNMVTLVGVGVLDDPQVENTNTKVMTLTGTFLSVTEINTEIVICINTGRRGLYSAV